MPASCECASCAIMCWLSDWINYMKLRPLSDLHLEFVDYYPRSLPSVGEDVVILSGDIGVGTAGVQWALDAIPDRPVIYVLGNHEFYKQDFQTLLGKCKKLAEGTNVYVLDNEEITIKGQRFVCATLWTDFALLGDEQMIEAARWSGRYLNDYRLIKNGNRVLSTEDTFNACEDSKAYLAKALSTGDPAVVVTHHAPTPATINPFFAGKISNASFHSNLDSLFNERVQLWVHGHTHHSCKKTVNGIPVVTNQNGYPHENVGFDWNLIIEVPDLAPVIKPKGVRRPRIEKSS